MMGQMIEFEADGATAPGYLATPDTATGQGSSSCIPGGG